MYRPRLPRKPGSPSCRPSRLLALLCLAYFLLLRPSSHPSYEPATSPPPQAGPLARYLDGKKFLVVQVDNRLRLWESPPVFPPGDFSNGTLGPSILDMRHFATRKGYAYVFFLAPQKCVGPREERVSPLWCKVPAILYAVRVCRNHRMEAVMFVDTDVGETSSDKFGIPEVLRQAPSAHLFVTPAHNSSWKHWLIKSSAKQPIYTRGAINSGSLVVRCTAEGQALISSWWFERTAMKSPYELAKSPSEMITVFTAELPLDALEARNPLAAIAALPFLNSSAGGSSISTQVRSEISRDAAGPLGTNKLILDVKFQPLNLSFGAAYRKFKRQVCRNPLLGQLFVKRLVLEATNGTIATLPESRVDFTCTLDYRNTLLQWPGDQDRLNWLFDSTTPGLVALANNPHIASVSNRSDTVVVHWSISYKVRSSSSRLASMRAKERERGGEDWERIEGWKAVMSRVPVFRVDPKMSSMQILAALDVAGGAEESFFTPAKWP